MGTKYVLENPTYIDASGIPLRPGRVCDASVDNITLIQAQGGILTPQASDPDASARAARLQSAQTTRGQGNYPDPRAPAWLPPVTSANATSALVTHTTSPYTASPTDRLIECDVSAGTVTVNMEASPVTLSVHEVKNSAGDASINIITVSGNGNNIEDPNTPLSFGATATIRVQGGFVTWRFDGTRWVVVA
jgi:hypothetical protein